MLLVTMQIRNVLLRLFFLTNLLFVSCKGQEKNDIKVDENLIGVSLSSTFKQIYNDGGFDYIKSDKLSKLINSSSNLFVKLGGGKLQNGTTYTEIAIVEKASDIRKKINCFRYIFIEKNNIISDTIKINKDFDFSPNILMKADYKSGIAIGKYDKKKEFFEISKIVAVNDQGKFVNLNLDTIIYDCPVPSNYITDEDTGKYQFGIIGGKKYSRFWNENIHDGSNDNVITTESVWSIDCDPSSRSITLKLDKTLVISMETNQYYVTLEEKSKEGNVRDYQYKEMSGFGSVDYDSKTYRNSETVCRIEISDKNVLKFNWFGFYDKELKKYVEIENPFTGKVEPIILKKCDE